MHSTDTSAENMKPDQVVSSNRDRRHAMRTHSAFLGRPPWPVEWRSLASGFWRLTSDVCRLSSVLHPLGFLHHFCLIFAPCLRVVTLQVGLRSDLGPVFARFFRPIIPSSTTLLPPLSPVQFRIPAASFPVHPTLAQKTDFGPVLDRFSSPKSITSATLLPPLLPSVSFARSVAGVKP
jgi:hypothetical protein